MIFRQIFDPTSFTYTYLIASRREGRALIVDPVLDGVEDYMRLLHELGLKLEKAVDTHLHADHITGLGALKSLTECKTVMGAESAVDRVSLRMVDGDRIKIGKLDLHVIHTPGHTDDSYCFLIGDRVLTGDTLLIRGTGRTDFQSGDAGTQYDSIVNKLFKLPGETLVYPGHDYNGHTSSTIREEKAFNPRLQVHSASEYAEIMNNLNLDNPKMMKLAVSANQHIGLHPFGSFED